MEFGKVVSQFEILRDYRLNNGLISIFKGSLNFKILERMPK